MKSKEEIIKKRDLIKEFLNENEFLQGIIITAHRRQTLNLQLSVFNWILEEGDLE